MLGVGDRARLRTPLEPLRGEPSHRAELVSEILGGEELECLGSRGEWLEVRGEDGYEGWIHEWTCEVESSFAGGFAGRYRHPLGTLWVSDHFAAAPLLLGTPLLETDAELARREKLHLVRTPWGSQGWLPESAIADFATPAASVADLLNGARALLGTPYRWGGRSPLGFDCSGFVQYAFALCDRRLRRDAGLQAGQGEEISVTEVERGDLLFFGTPIDHVGIVSGRDRLIHCSGWVREERLSENPQLVERRCAARRVFDEVGGLGPSWWAGRGLGSGAS